MSSLKFDLDLPFEPDVHEVIYVEKEYHPTINEYIQNNYESIQRQFFEKKAVFIYLPKLCEQVVPEEAVHYMLPQLKQNTPVMNGNISMETFKQHLIYGSIEEPALIHYVKMLDDPPKDHFFTYRPLDTETSLTEQFDRYLERISFQVAGGQVFFSLAKPKSEDDRADFYFRDNELEDLSYKSDRTLAEEIQRRVVELRKRGVQRFLLQELIEEKPTLSRLVIDKDFRIFLPDYNNIEITMSPLPKAVYILFLLHPEGIPFKQLDYCFPELYDLYKLIGNREIEQNIIQSIADITDPTKNSINEKCARIREAFLKHFDTTYAQYYYITGKRGEPKKVTLPRELVDLQGLQNVLLRTAMVQ